MILECLKLTFAVVPEERPTALLLLETAFCKFDIGKFHFISYKVVAIKRKEEMDRILENGDDEDYNDEDCEDDD